jgi:GNAT superfamily N-acetyltransferase
LPLKFGSFMNFTLEKASLEHIPLLTDTRVDFLSEYWGKQEADIENKLREELNSFFENEIPAQTYIAWLAFDSGKIAGVGGMKITKKPGSFRVPDGNCAYIMNMYTLPQYRKKGIAKTILNKLIEAGEEMGITFFELHATKEGEAVYVKNGFNLHKEPTYRKFIL